jgi:hypothetical protein
LSKKRANPESGFAVLFIYAMAATIAIMLYMELPRVAFEAQRDKEQLLIDRGEQYSRAVTLFVRKFNRYPADFDALQNTQNLRFLRHKYIDPMTGKDDWRIIHVGPGGVFTDSLVYGKKKDGKATTEQQNFITEMQQTGGNQAGTNQQGVNIGTRQRQSDQPGAPGDPNNPAQPGAFPAGGGAPPDPNAPPATGVNGPMQVLPDGRIVPVFQPQQQGQQGNQPGFPGQFQPATNGFPNGLPPGVQLPQGVNQTAAPGQPFPNNFPQQGQPGGFQPPNGPPAAAANLINQILTTPRPGGLNGLGNQQQATVDQNGNPVPAQGATTQGGLTAPGAANNTGTPTAPMGGQVVGGGMAGVASKLEQDGIKVYKDRTPYNEWEFVYDITKDTSRGGAAGAQSPAPAQNGANPTNPTATPGTPAAPATPAMPAIPTPPPPPPPAPVTPQ